MNIKEYTKKLQNYYDENKLKEADSYGEGYTDGILEALDYATRLSKELDEPKKVVIPQFVADWIEEAKLYSGNELDPLGIIYYMGDYIGSEEPHCEWLKNIYNQKLLLNAIANGYEVEKPKYGVIVKGFGVKDGYLILSSDSNCFFLGNRKIYSRSINTFTKQYLAENWPEYEAYNNAELLEFEEAENE